MLDGLGGLAQGNTRGQVEREGHRCKLALMIDRQVGVARLESGHRGERNQLAGVRFDVDRVERIWIRQKPGIRFEHDVMLVEPFVEGGDLALTEGVVKRAVDGGRRHAQSRSGIAVDDDVGLQAACLLVARDVAQEWVCAQLAQERVGPVVQLAQVSRLHRVLILGLA